jgi:dTDP-4-dehydrorhamnose 3,5-epimerase
MALDSIPSSGASVRTGLPRGVVVRPLEPHADDRGTFTEIFRAAWDSSIDGVQWNVVRSAAGVLRGVHVHPRHDDYLTVLEGSATIGLLDLREDARDAVGTTVDLRADAPSAITIPHGVAHGFYFHEPSLHVYAVSTYWNIQDELGCRWDDPELRIPWPMSEAVISERDASLPALDGLRAQLRAARP